MIKMMVEMIREAIAGGLRKRYESVKAVDGISFQVQAGEIFGMVGSNGSGATQPPNAQKDFANRMEISYCVGVRSMVKNQLVE